MDFAPQNPERSAAPVAVVIVTWNSARYISDCLSSLRALERRPAEVAVVDNGSVDGTLDRIRENHPETLLLDYPQNLGFCRANNIGISRTSSPFVLVLNPDTHLDRRFLEELLPAFEDPSVGIAAGKLLRFDGITIDSAGQALGRSRQPIDRGYGRRDRGQFERDEEVFGACGAAALYRRAMLESVTDGTGEIFDEAFFAFYEDLDLAWRARKLGWKAVYRHRAIGFHARGGTASAASVRRPGRALLARSPDLRFHAVKNRYLTILRNDTLRAVLGNLPMILGRDLATALLLMASSPQVFVRLWRERALFRRAIERRRLDAGRAALAKHPGAPR